MPLIQLSIWGSPDRAGLLISAVPPLILLGFKGAIYSGQLRLDTVCVTSIFAPLIVERIVPRTLMVSRGAHLKEGKAINISITAGVIVHINSINVNILYLYFHIKLDYIFNQLKFSI